MKLAPLTCSGCGACVPLRNAPSVTCSYCGAHVKVPKAYRALWAEHAAEARIRREAEQQFRVLARAPSHWFDRLAVALVLLLPVAASATTALSTHHAPPIVTMFVAVVVPALLPGTGVWLWSASLHATIVRFHLALAGDPPERDGGPPLCRNCGAALFVEPDAISATCHYCGVDSLVTDLAAARRRVQSELRSELRTLAQAIEVLRLRRRMLVAGATAAPLLLGALMLAAWWAYRAG